MNIEIIKGVCLYNLGKSYYVPKPQALASVGLCELSYTTILNRQKANKWLQNKGFSSTQPKEIPSLGNCHFCEIFSLESWISLLEYLSTFRQNSKAIETLDTLARSLLPQVLTLNQSNDPL